MMIDGQSTTQVSASGPGRLGDPHSSPASDLRTAPRLLAALAAIGADVAAPAPELTRDNAFDEVYAFVGQMEQGIEDLYETLPNELPGDGQQSVTHTTATVEGIDGNEITLHLYRPDGIQGAIPCIIYVHGGGMTMSLTDNKVHRQWAADLASTGAVVVAVDFRNAYGPDGPHPFPAGLHDCRSAVQWVHAHRDTLGITKIVLQGESGGANLVLATAMLAKQDGDLANIAGVYATVPYISGAYGWDEDRKLLELPSLVENDGYFANCAAVDLLATVYDPTRSNADNPLCWPYFSTESDLEGLPPHVISVNELDVFRDEGIAHFRRLARAGVSVVGRINLGLTHAAELIFRQALAEVYLSTVADIKRFADSL